MEENNKENESVLNKDTNPNGVVITVYVESMKTRSEDPTKKTKAHPHFNITRDSVTHGYDRRAQLLEYSRKLRNQGSENVPLPTNQSHTKTINKSKVKSMLKEGKSYLVDIEDIDNF
ncbi:unnamed protein product [Lupinus luteus]|uniref:Uncharacterized protein n=1 Tax=Lupinus luteus TaxID=3873 RepID=A0AAV1Y055_LUPLU